MAVRFLVFLNWGWKKIQRKRSFYTELREEVAKLHKDILRYKLLENSKGSKKSLRDFVFSLRTSAEQSNLILDATS